MDLGLDLDFILKSIWDRYSVNIIAVPLTSTWSILWLIWICLSSNCCLTWGTFIRQVSWVNTIWLPRPKLDLPFWSNLYSPSNRVASTCVHYLSLVMVKLSVSSCAYSPKKFLTFDMRILSEFTTLHLEPTCTQTTVGSWSKVMCAHMKSKFTDLDHSLILGAVSFLAERPYNFCLNLIWGYFLNVLFSTFSLHAFKRFSNSQFKCMQTSCSCSQVARRCTPIQAQYFEKEKEKICIRIRTDQDAHPK